MRKMCLAPVRPSISRGIPMTGCLSREQLANLMAERKGEDEGSEIGAHARSCPKCRALLEAWSQAGTMEFSPASPDDGATVAETLVSYGDPLATWSRFTASGRSRHCGGFARAGFWLAHCVGRFVANGRQYQRRVFPQARALSADESTTWGDSPPTVDGITPGPSPAQAPASPAAAGATVADSLQTVASISGSSSAATLDLPSGAAPPFQRQRSSPPGTALTTPPRLPRIWRTRGSFPTQAGLPRQRPPPPTPKKRRSIFHRCRRTRPPISGRRYSPGFAKTVPAFIRGPGVDEKGPAGRL